MLIRTIGELEALEPDSIITIKCYAPWINGVAVAIKNQVGTWTLAGYGFIYTNAEILEMTPSTNDVITLIHPRRFGDEDLTNVNKAIMDECVPYYSREYGEGLFTNSDLARAALDALEGK